MGMILDNLSIGVDIESISRFKDLNRSKDRNLLIRVFTKKEMKYCFSKKYPAQYLAVRFAAKEAIIKAINQLNRKAPHFSEIEIVNNKKGVPLVNLKKYDIKISLSHCKNKAVAFAVVALKK